MKAWKRASLVVMILAGCVCELLAGGAGRVEARKKREKLLGKVEAYLYKETGISYTDGEVLAGLSNPFMTAEVETFEEVFEEPEEVVAQEVKEEVVEKPVSAKDILLAITRKIKPTGSIMRRGGGFTLLFGQKFVDEGDVIKAQYDGKVYELEVTTIEENLFILKYEGVRIRKKFDVLTVGAASVE